MASSLGIGNSASEHFYKSEITVTSLEHFQKILDSTEIDLKEFSNDMAYSGFDKNKIAKMAATRLGAKRVVKLCLLGGMRGTNLKKILSKSQKVDSEISEAYRTGKILSNGSGPEDLTMGRLMATFPEIVGHYLLKTQCAKKLSNDPCHAALQFPAAAGLPMTHTVRMQHLEFSIKFSFLISQDKKFYAQYYRAALNGQQEVKRVSNELQVVCGNPTNQESKQFDFDAAMSGFAEKYGAERIVMNSGAQGDGSDVKNIPV